MIARAAFLVVAAMAVVPAGTGHARSISLLPYPMGEIWPTAVRFLRVDRGYELKEKDEPSGYVLFDVLEGGKTHKASLELIRTTDGEGREATRFVLSVPNLPRHFEVMLLDKLELKVRDERGSPVAAPPRREKAPTQDRDKRPDAGDGMPRFKTLKDLPR